jgi:hypothetical protein
MSTQTKLKDYYHKSIMIKPYSCVEYETKLKFTIKDQSFAPATGSLGRPGIRLSRKMLGAELREVGCCPRG